MKKINHWHNLILMLLDTAHYNDNQTSRLIKVLPERELGIQNAKYKSQHGITGVTKLDLSDVSTNLTTEEAVQKALQLDVEGKCYIDGTFESELRDIFSENPFNRLKNYNELSPEIRAARPFAPTNSHAAYLLDHLENFKPIKTQADLFDVYREIDRILIKNDPEKAK